MSPSPISEAPRPGISAQNHASGCQYLGPEDGDQNVVSSHGVQFNDRSDHRQYTTFAFHLQSDLSGIPSVWNLAQALKTSKTEPTEPTNVVLVEWLMRQDDHSPLDVSSKHLEVVSQMTPETGNWILESQELLQWQDPSVVSHCYLGIYGLLGSGKTVIVSLVIDALRARVKDKSDTACVYFYFHEGDDKSPPVARIWSTLLLQLLQHERVANISDELKSKFVNSFRGSAPIHPLEYFKLFKAQSCAFKTVYLIIDAFDSCTNSSNEKTRQLMQEGLMNLPFNVRVLFTSRNDSIIRDLGISQKLIISRFLLAKLHLHNLSKQGTLTDINVALEQLPSTSSRAFEASIRRILSSDNAFEIELAKHAFTWVVNAKVNLTVDQVRESFAIQRRRGSSYQESRPSRDAVLSSCAGLIVEDAETKTLKLIHESLKNHLQEHQVLDNNPHLVIAKTCLTSLLVGESGQLKSSLLAYSSNHWCYHLCKPSDSELQGLVKRFLSDTESLAVALRLIPGISVSSVDGITGLHAAVYYNRLIWIKRLLSSGLNINSQCSNGQTPLHWAAIHGRYKLLEYLVQKSADTNVQDKSGDTALHKLLMGSSTEGHSALQTVQCLIHGGARVDIKGSKGLTPLSSVIRYGPTSIARLMIKNLKDVNAEVTAGWSPLREVFYHAHEMIHKLDKKDDNSSRDDGWTPLRDAVRNHVDGLIQFLLDRGVDLNRPTSDGWLPVLHTVKGGDCLLLQRLLERQPDPADANQRDVKDGKSALHWAFVYKQHSAVRLLIDHGANVNDRDPDGLTPLIRAVSDKNEELVWLLLTKGAEVDCQDGKGRLPLHYAIKSKNKSIVWLLVSNKANVTIRNTKVPSFLDLALQKGEYSIAWLLCQHGADISEVDDKGMTTLHRSCHSGKLNDAKFLLDNGVNPRAKDAAGSTALHYAVLGGREEIVRLLVSRGSVRDFINEADAKGNPALIIATLRRSKAMVRDLINNGASRELQDVNGLAALHHAARLGFNEGLKSIIHEMNVDMPDRQGYTAVHHAVVSSEANDDTIRFLRAEGVQLEVQDRAGLTPLMLAVHLGRVSKTRELLSLGVDRHARNFRGWSAIDVINSEGHESREHAFIKGFLKST